MATISLRQVCEADLALFFEHQLDPVANTMAGFTSPDPTDKSTFLAHWAKLFADDAIIIQTVLLDDEVAGYIVCHQWFGVDEVSYWLDKAYWGQGVATEALRQFVALVAKRPLYARIIFDNIGSKRVLEKCGFQPYGQDRGYANARRQEVEEILFKLD